MICIINNSIPLVCGHGIRKGFCPGRSQIFSHYNYTTRFVKCQEHLAIFFASNFEPCVRTAIDAVSNFHISWKLQLEAGRQLSNFQADESCKARVKFSHHRSCKARVKFYMLPEAATAAFSRGRQLSWDITQLPKLEILRKIIIIIIIIPLLLYYIFKKISNFFRA